MALVSQDPFAADPVDVVSQQSPQFDPTAFADAMRGTMKEGLDTIAKAVATPQRVQVDIKQPPQAPVKQEPDPLRDAVMEALAPTLQTFGAKLDQVSSEIQATKDAVGFYTERNIDPAERAEVERMFQALHQSGHPFTRQDIMNWRVGKMTIEAKNHEAAVARAAAASASVGSGSPAQGSAEPRDPWSMSQDALNKALEGVAF